MGSLYLSFIIKGRTILTTNTFISRISLAGGQTPYIFGTHNYIASSCKYSTTVVQNYAFKMTILLVFSFLTESLTGYLYHSQIHIHNICICKKIYKALEWKLWKSIWYVTFSIFTKKMAEIHLLILSYFSVSSCPHVSQEPVNRCARNQILIISDKSAISKFKFLLKFGQQLTFYVKMHLRFCSLLTCSLSNIYPSEKYIK